VDEMIAFCGLYCGACSFKVAFDESDRNHLRNMPDKYRECENAPLQFCPGCRLDSEGHDCRIRECARSRGLVHCGACDQFPCALIQEFNDDGIPHHSEAIGNLQLLKEVGEEAWLRAEKERWTCTCGAKRSWYLKECPKCGRGFQNA
jgi:hypothetical protein